MQLDKKQLRRLTLGIIILVSMGCSSRPSESDANAMLDSYWKQQMRGYEDVEVQVVNFRKTNGLAEIKDGAKYYTMDYQAEVIFPKGNRHLGGDDYKPGEGFLEKGNLRFVKTEEGWRLVDKERSSSERRIPAKSQ